MRTYSAFAIYGYKSEDQEIMLAKLSMYPFEAFEEKEDSIIAYIANEEIEDNLKEDLLAFLGAVTIEITQVPDINWNAQWEADFKPVYIGQFCQIRASFHEHVSGYEQEIIINPKMAFGTAHHETTYMMIQAMQSLSMTNKSVFDYGCGTGILAILAAKMGASRVDAIDYDQEAADNTLENIALNNVSLDKVARAELDDWPAFPYDLILANINRKVLLDQAEYMSKFLGADGLLLISGVLETDSDLVGSTYEKKGFQLENKWQRNEWMCLLFKRC